MISDKKIKRNNFIFLIPLFLLFITFYFHNTQKNNSGIYDIQLKDIFDNNSTRKLKPEEEILTVISTGDVSLAKEINNLSINEYKNFTWPFEKISSILRNSDIAIINLESPIFPNCDKPDLRYYILCGNSKFTDGFKYSGINVVNVANNHILDYGINNAEKELSILKNSDIAVSGIDEDAILNIKNTRVGFLGFNDIKFNDIEPARGKNSQNIILQANNNENVITRIKKLRNKSDILITSFHWGKEYTDEITGRQKELAHLAIDSGADLVIGNHPHWIQPVEIYKNKMIVYSHGSLIFNQNNFEIAKSSSTQTKIGIIGKYYFKGNVITGAEFIPISIGINNQPRPAENNEKNQILNMLKEESIRLSNLY